MKKILKRILSLVIVCGILFSVENSAMAAEPAEESPKITEYTNVLEGEEGIKRIAEIYNISYGEAEAKYNDLRAGVDRLEERYIQQDVGMGYIIEVGCLVQVQCGVGHCNYVVVNSTWSNVISSGNATWEQFYAYATIEGTLKDTLRFQARGNLVVTASQSLSSGFSAAGFTIGGSTGTTCYYRKTVSINQTL